MTVGAVMLGVSGLELNGDDVRRLKVGGVILFSRNYESPEQLSALTGAIRAIRTPTLLIAVDHEGGRVQRFRDGFTALPPMRALGRLWDDSPPRAKEAARRTGYVLGAELRAHGVDFSFTPVLDIDFGHSRVIGDRAFHRDPQVIADLAHALQRGLHEAGTGTVGKHFPGHGHVVADSHVAVPADDRDLVELELADLLPFQRMTDYGMTGIMPAHVIYPKVDSVPAGYSHIWLQDILRIQLGFEGAVFSDDLCMEGAKTAGGIVARARMALTAGCDMVLICNSPEGADEILATLHWEMPPVSVARLTRMRGAPRAPSREALARRSEYQAALQSLMAMGVDQFALGSDPTIAHG
jgi:beta-N-acetylhexosaminidase